MSARPCDGASGNVCVAEGCFGEACLTVAEAADRDRFERTLTDRIETFDEAELLRALRHLAHDPAAMDAVNDALDAVVRGDA